MGLKLKINLALLAVVVIASAGIIAFPTESQAGN